MLFARRPPVSCAPARTATRASTSSRPPARRALRCRPPGAPIAPVRHRAADRRASAGGRHDAGRHRRKHTTTGRVRAGDTMTLPPPPATGNVIALILPLEVPAYERAVDAVRDGFLDAAEAAGVRGTASCSRNGPTASSPHSNRQRGAACGSLVGPAGSRRSEDARAVRCETSVDGALNQPDDDVRMPAAMFAFPLTVESDGRTLAQRVMAGGGRRSTDRSGDSLLMKRLAGASRERVDRRRRTGAGRVPLRSRARSADQPAPHARRQTNPDAVLLAVSGDRGAAEAVHRQHSRLCERPRVRTSAARASRGSRRRACRRGLRGC